MAAEANKPAVVGIKAHLSTIYSSNPKATELELVRMALEAAEASRLPLMVHANETYYPLSDSLKMLRKGDILTHCFSDFGPIDSPLDANGKYIAGGQGRSRSRCDLRRCIRIATLQLRCRGKGHATRLLARHHQHRPQRNQ